MQGKYERSHAPLAIYGGAGEGGFSGELKILCLGVCVQGRQGSNLTLRSEEGRV
jgi:hypothetical protein